MAATIDAGVLPSMPKLSRKAASQIHPRSFATFKSHPNYSFSNSPGASLASAMFFTSSDPILAEQHIRYFGR
ncbi:hypothetical protein TorRG33x02_189330 [Trema orientale]|uniref:Uncharacterized protein n=1 Tax=Trema orientale TaxID=63057 RepID=A0A2P5EIA8_TREOI|nr:hypothetical protein TorRG33x02_189330 [Trema orientale]